MRKASLALAPAAFYSRPANLPRILQPSSRLVRALPFVFASVSFDPGRAGQLLESHGNRILDREDQSGKTTPAGCTPKVERGARRKRKSDWSLLAQKPRHPSLLLPISRSLRPEMC